MIDPASIIALVAAVNQFAAVEAEEKRVVGIIGILSETLFCLFLGDAFSPVFDDACTGRNLASCKHTIAVDVRVPDLDE